MGTGRELSLPAPMNHENLPRHIAERIVADFGANTEFALQELEKYRVDPSSVGQEWQDYFGYVLSLPEPEGNTETATFLRQPVTVRISPASYPARERIRGAVNSASASQSASSSTSR